MKKILLTICSLTLSLSCFAKGYQVTGPVVEINDKKIVVKKGNDNWELAKNAATKIPAGIKVGDKVTVYYSMTADEVEVKSAKKK
jgi:hypothetical protein